MTAAEPCTRECPYVGLDPFSEKDARFFFGREREGEMVLSNLMASKLTVFYGPSGVGKSSVLRAGVLWQSQMLARRNLEEVGSAEFIPVYVNSWKDDPAGELAEAIRAAAGSAWAGGRKLPEPGNVPLSRLLGDWSASLGCTLLIILDQFEEYFQYHPAEDGEGSLAEEFPAAAAMQGLPVNFLISIREDAVARLDRFKKRLPKLLDNRLSIGYLDRKDAARAITEPVARYDTDYPRADGEHYRVDEDAVDEVLEQVAVDPERRCVQTPYLQLVMTRLWETETGAGSARLRKDTLTTQLGGPRNIVKDHLRHAMATLVEAERDVAAVVFRYLVTGSGTKIALSVADLAGYAAADIPSCAWVDIPREDIAGYLGTSLPRLLEKLASKDFRVLRPVPAQGRDEARYEISHDVLAASILEWRSHYIADQEAGVQIAREREIAERRVAEERRQAEEAWQMYVRAHAREVTFAAALRLGSNPELAALLLLDSAGDIDAAQQPALSAQADDLLQRALLSVRARSFIDLGEPLSCLGMTAEGDLVVAAIRGNCATVWNTRDNRVLLQQDFEDVIRVALSRDGGRLAFATQWDVRLWDVGTGREVVAPTRPREWINDFFWSPTGQQFALCQYGSLAVCDVSSGQVVTLPFGQRIVVTSAGFSEDGSVVAGVGQDGSVQVWRVASASLLASFRLEDEPATTIVAFSPDARLAAAAVTGGEVEVWDIETKSRKYILRGHTISVFDVTFDKSGERIATAAADGTARLWDSRSGRELFTLSGFGGAVTGVRFSRDGETLATSSWDGTARLWSAALDHTQVINALAFSPTGQYIATGGADGVTNLWEWRSGTRKLHLRLEDSPGGVSNLAFSDDGKLLATGGADRLLRIWDVAGGPSVIVPAHDDRITGLSFCEPGRAIVTGSRDGRLRWWNRETGEMLYSTDPHTYSIEEVVCAASGPVMAVAFSDQRVVIWDTAERKSVRELTEVRKQHKGRVASLAISPDAKLLATCSYDGTTKLWDIVSGELAGDLTGHKNIVFRVAFSPDGKRIATASLDHTVRVWDTSTARQLRVYNQNGEVFAVAFSPDGRLLAAGGGDKTLNVIPLDRSELLSLARSRMVRPLTSGERESYLGPQSSPASDAAPAG